MAWSWNATTGSGKTEQCGAEQSEVAVVLVGWWHVWQKRTAKSQEW